MKMGASPAVDDALELLDDRGDRDLLDRRRVRVQRFDFDVEPGVAPVRAPCSPASRSGRSTLPAPGRHPETVDEDDRVGGSGHGFLQCMGSWGAGSVRCSSQPRIRRRESCGKREAAARLRDSPRALPPSFCTSPALARDRGPHRRPRATSHTAMPHLRVLAPGRIAAARSPSVVTRGLRARADAIGCAFRRTIRSRHPHDEERLR